jgi:mRNA interferase MazF
VATSPKRGDLFWVDWSPGRGSEQLGLRPSLIISTDAGNTNPVYPNVIVVCLTTSGRDDIATYVPVTPSKENGLKKRSHVKCEQILTISKERLYDRLGELSPSHMAQVDATIKKVLSLA